MMNFQIRLKASGVGPTIQANEYGHNLNIPKEVWDSPQWQTFIELCIKHVFIINDVFSLKKELKDQNNLNKIMFNTVTVITATEGLTIEESLAKTVTIIEQTEEAIKELMEKLDRYRKLDN